jgi:hypothetical protein
MCSAAAVVLSWTRIAELLPTAANLQLSGDIGRRILEAIEGVLSSGRISTALGEEPSKQTESKGVWNCALRVRVVTLSIRTEAVLQFR